MLVALLSSFLATFLTKFLATFLVALSGLLQNFTPVIIVSVTPAYDFCKAAATVHADILFIQTAITHTRRFNTHEYCIWRCLLANIKVNFF